MHIYLICIGSNFDRENNILLARTQLTALYPSVRFADEEETKPFLLTNPELFTNQVGCFRTEEKLDDVKTKLKDIERRAGRLPGDKVHEVIKLDIDILACDGIVLKPQDMKREYIVRGIRALAPNHQIEI